jgi:hypothetical protein
MWFGLMAGMAAEPAPLPDPIGLGERLLLIEYLRERGQEPPPGAALDDLRRAYWQIQADSTTNTYVAHGSVSWDDLVSEVDRLRRALRREHELRILAEDAAAQPRVAVKANGEPSAGAVSIAAEIEDDGDETNDLSAGVPVIGYERSVEAQLRQDLAALREQLRGERAERQLLEQQLQAQLAQTVLADGRKRAVPSAPGAAAGADEVRSFAVWLLWLACAVGALVLVVLRSRRSQHRAQDFALQRPFDRGHHLSRQAEERVFQPTAADPTLDQAATSADDARWAPPLPPPP